MAEITDTRLLHGDFGYLHMQGTWTARVDSVPMMACRVSSPDRRSVWSAGSGV